MLWNLKIFLLSLESEQNSNQTMDFIVTPNATCKNISMNTNSEEKDILRNIENLNNCEDIETRLNICCLYTGKENVREKFFLSEQI